MLEREKRKFTKLRATGGRLKEVVVSRRSVHHSGLACGALDIHPTFYGRDFGPL